MLTNWVGRFGVAQRCLEGNRPLTDLLPISVHYDRDVNFYIYEEDFHFLGVLNKRVLRQLDASPEQWGTRTLREACQKCGGEEKNKFPIYGSGGGLEDILYDAFVDDFPYSDEIAVISDDGRLYGIYKRREVFHEKHPVSIDSDTDMVCYRETSHYYERVKYRDNLFRYTKNVNSQNGEDGIIDEIFKRIGVTSKFAVEFGGWDGVYLSNIRRLITEEGFDGLFIEGDAEKAKKCAKNYKDYPGVRCANAYVGFRGEHTLDNILKENQVPEQIDLVSIDIDGYDYHVWEAFREYRPRVIVIEYNPTIQNDVIMINPRNEQTFCGSSAAALVELGRRKGYSLAAATFCNLLFVVDEEYNKLQIWDNDLSMIRGEWRVTDGRYFQTYDKRFILTGITDYLWGDSAFYGKPYILSEVDKSAKLIFSGI